MHEDDLAARREHDVGCTWQIPPVEPESVSQPVQGAAECEFGLCVPLPDL